MDNRSKKLSSAKKVKACRRRELSKEDGLSGLPNEIIIDILSLLTLKEAGQTSVLSKRWKYVWAYVPVLNFDASDAIYKIDSHETSFEVETPRYLNWVNQVVGSYRRTTIDEFRVRFLLDNDDTDSIDNWLNFAIKKRVKKLEYNFSGVRSNHYTFRNVLSGCNSLTSLQLASVSITGDIVQNLLKACSALEYLSVKYSHTLVSLELTEETPNLKYLELLCYVVERIEINAPNLVSFKYKGRIINVPFAKIPKLTQLFIGGSYCNDVVTNLLRFSSHLCQLEALTLDLAYLPGAPQISFDQFPVCAKLKQLELITYPVNGSPLCYIPIIKACPFLHKFVLKLQHYKVDKRRKLSQVEAYPHHHLKIIEVCGFVGCAPDIEFTRYLMKSCVALDKIIIDPRHPLHIGTPGEFLQGKKMKEARKKAEKKLRPFLNPGVDLVIIKF